MAREMKDSGIEWIGEIPREWEITRMKSCILQRDGGAWGEEPKGDEYDVVCMRIADFDYSSYKFKNVPCEQLTKRHYEKNVIEKLLLQKNDILIEKSGGGEKTPVGRTVIFDKEYTALFANFMDRLRCASFINHMFMQYLFVTFYKNMYIRNYIKQTTGIQNLDVSTMLSKELIPIPLLNEQQKIADYLDAKCSKIDEIIAKIKTTIDEYKKLKQSVITEAVTKGIRPDREMKDSGIEWIGEIPKEWDVRKLIRVITKIGDIDHYMPETTETGIPYLMTGDLRDNLSEVYIENCKHVSNDDFFKLSKKIKAEKGDVIFARYATIGTISFVDVEYDFLISYSCLIIKPMCNVLIGKYLFYYLKSSSFSHDIKQYVNLNTQSNIGLDSMFKIKITLPNVQEQQEIADYLDKKCAEIDAVIAKKEQLVTELENYKKSLIYEYVTGKKEVV